MAETTVVNDVKVKLKLHYTSEDGVPKTLSGKIPRALAVRIVKLAKRTIKDKDVSELYLRGSIEFSRQAIKALENIALSGGRIVIGSDGRDVFLGWVSSFKHTTGEVYYSLTIAE